MDPREAEPEQQLADAEEPDSRGDVGEDAEPDAGEAPAVVPNDGKSFRLFQLRVGPDGALGGRQREQLPRPVFGRSVALKYLTFYAKQLAPSELLVLVDVNGGVAAVAQGGTGRLRPTLKREVRKVLAQSFNVTRERRDGAQRRTSRPARGTVATRRTSRKPGRR